MLLRKFISVEFYICLLWALFFLSFLDSPLSWYNDVVFDLRYVNVYAVYTATLYFSYLYFYAIIPSRQTGSSDDLEVWASRANWVYYAVIIFCICRFIALKQIPLFGDLRARYDENLSLGGFVGYTCTLANPLAIFYMFCFQKLKNKKYIWRSVLLLALQALYFRRQDIFEIILGIIFILNYNKRITLGKATFFIVAGGIAAYIILGLGQILRAGGADSISRTVGFWELPFWVIIGDVTAATKFGYYITDVVGSAGLSFNYTLGEFYSIFSRSGESHGAEYLMKMFTSRETAQSITAPLSYFLDGGLLYVSILGVIHGLVWGVVRKAEKASPAMTIINILFFVQALWSVRSGEMFLYPLRLYEIMMILYIFAPKRQQLGPSYFGYLVKIAFTSTFLVTLLFLAIRLPAKI
jgi:hypothetical protein